VAKRSNGGGVLKAQRLDAAELFGALVAEQLAQPNVTLGRALQNEALMVRGKIFAFLKAGRLVVKLPAPRVTELVARGGAEPFRSGGRAMKEWISIEPRDETLWRTLVADARRYVAAGRGVRG
jgi:hypothetical protein